LTHYTKGKMTLLKTSFAIKNKFQDAFITFSPFPHSTCTL